LLFVPLNLLKPGMILAESIPSHNLYLPLLTPGQTLTERSIRSLIDHGIQGAYIDTPVAEGIQPQAFFTPEKRLSLIEGIKSAYDRVRSSGTMPNGKLFDQMAADVVLSALKQDQLLFNVITIRNYDDYTYTHSLYVAGIATLIGTHMKLPHQHLLSLATAGLLHDIGKLDISLNIINKPAALTEDEYTAMRDHPLLGVSRLSKSKSYRDNILKGVESHHEHFDGGGYPHQLLGENIPLFGRILAIADVYDALSSTRSYRAAWNPSQIIDYISSRSASQFDPDILPAFLHSVAAYPVGTMVRLSNGWVGIVTKNHPEFILRPSLRVLKPAEEAGRELDLVHSMFHVTVTDLADDSDGIVL